MRRQYLDTLETGYLSSPELPLFSSDPYQVDPFNYHTRGPLKPCLKRPYAHSSDLLSAGSRMYQGGRHTSTPSAFQPFSTIAEDTVWDPYSYRRQHMPTSRSFQNNNMKKNINQYRNINPTQFRSEISRFTESLYDLAKPIPVKPKGHFPRVDDTYPKVGNPSSILNPGLPMKPVQNLDRINPFTGLPNVEFVPTTEYMRRKQSTYLPDWTPSPDTTARRVAAILEPQNTYADLVHSFQKRQVEQQNLQSMEEKFKSFSMQHIEPSALTMNSHPYYSAPRINNQVVNADFSNFPLSQSQHPILHPPSHISYAQAFPANVHDPTFLDKTQFNRQQTVQIQNPQILPVNNIAFDQNQLDQAWRQLSNELQVHNNMNPVNMTRIQETLPVFHPPLQGVLDMFDVNKVQQNFDLQPQSILDTQVPKHTSNLHFQRNNLNTTSNYQQEREPRNIDNTYESLLNLPKMPKSPSEIEPINSSEDELTRYNERRRDFRDVGNLHMKKFELSAKYHESKYVENSILGHVPSVLQDMGTVELEKKLNDKTKQIDKTLRQISRAYEDRCKQRQKMRSALSLVKEIPKMELDEHNNLITKDDTTKLKEIRRSKIGNTIKLDNMEIEVSNEIMSMIYHRALKKRMERKSPKCRPVERRRSRPKLNETKSQDSSETENEISEFMKNALLKQQLENTVPDTSREMKIRSLQRYSPRLRNPMIPVIEAESDGEHDGNYERMNNTRKEDEVKSTTSNLEIPESFCLWKVTDEDSQCKFLATDEPVPPPAPEIRIDKSLIGPGVQKAKESKIVPKKLKEVCHPIEPIVEDKTYKFSKESISSEELDNFKNNDKKPLPTDYLRKTKSSGAFENVPKNISKDVSEILSLKRQSSDPSENKASLVDMSRKKDDIYAKEENKQNKDLNISETAKKHLGMADDSKDSPVEEIGSRNRINSIFQTIGSSFEDNGESDLMKKEQRANQNDTDKESTKSTQSQLKISIKEVPSTMMNQSDGSQKTKIVLNTTTDQSLPTLEVFS